MYVAVGGVFAFDYLNLSLSAVCEVFYQFALRVEGEANRPDEVWFVVFWFVLQVYDVVGYRLWVVRVFYLSSCRPSCVECVMP